MTAETSARSGITLTRRGAVATTGAVALLATGGVRLSASPPPSAFDFVIDSHCHVFTGKDVPAAQFVMRVAAREDGFEAFDDIAAFAVTILRSFAPTARHEIEHLAGRQSFSLGNGNLFNQVLSTLKTLQGAAKVSPANSFEKSTAVQKLRDAGFALAPERLRLSGVNLNAEARAIATLRKNYPRPAHSPAQFSLSPPSDEEIIASFNTPAGFSLFDDLAALATAIVGDIESALSGPSKTALGRYLGMIAVFLSYRSENVRRLDSALGFAKPNQVRFYCPAIVDYDLWLGVGVDESQNLSEQALVMASVSRTADKNVLVAGYMAFDPLRAVVAKINKGPQDQSVLKVVEDAIEHRGFIGAKLYPPMGFKPWNNKLRTDDYGYGDWAPKKVTAALLAKGVDPSSFDLGAQLDLVLDEFYQYCLAKDVPILAHCGNSQTAFEGAGVRASPFFWEQLLQRPGYQNLRVNLGHFGGLWCASEDLATKSDESDRCRVSMNEESPWTTPGPRAWPIKIMSLVGAVDDHDNLLYPYLTCDISDIGALDTASGAQQITTLIKNAGNPAKAHGKILYGTDWMFLMTSVGYNKFPDNSKALADAINMNRDDLLWRNAKRFLGLTAASQSSKRLQEFYSADRKRLENLNAILSRA